MGRRLTRMLLVGAMIAGSVIGALPASAMSGPAPALTGSDEAGVFFNPATYGHVAPGTVGYDFPITVSVADMSGSCTAPLFATCDNPTGNVDLILNSSATGDVHLGNGHLTAHGDADGWMKWDGYPTVPAGSYTLTATYEGDGTFGTYSATTSVTINPASPYIIAHQSSTSSGLGEAVTFTACICGLSADHGQPKPTGTVQFKNYGKPLGAPVPVTVGGTSGIQAVLTTTKLPFGTAMISANYSGDSNYKAAHYPGALQHSVKATIACPPNCKVGPTGPIKTIGTFIPPSTTTTPTSGTTLTIGCMPHCPILTETSPSLPPAVSTAATTHVTAATGPSSTAPPTTDSTGPAAPTDTNVASAPPADGGSGGGGPAGPGTAAAGSSDAGSAGSGSAAMAAGAKAGSGPASAGSAGGSSIGSTGGGSASGSSRVSAAGSASGSAAALLAGGQPRPAAGGQSDTGFLQSHIWLLIVIIAVLLLLAAIAVYIVLRRRRPDEHVQ